MFEHLFVAAREELDKLKLGAEAVESRIEQAFSLGALHHALDAIKADASSVEDKIIAAFHLGRSMK